VSHEDRENSRRARAGRTRRGDSVDLPGLKADPVRFPRFPSRFRIRPLDAPSLRTLGPGSVSSLLKIGLDVAYVLLWIILGVLILAFVAAIFIPLDNLVVAVGDAADGRELPLERPMLLFAVGSFCAYFGAFALIVGRLRAIFRTLTLGDPFHPDNTSRLRQIGLILATVTGGVWLWQTWAARLSAGAMEPQGLGELLTPAFSVLVVFVLAEVFREGARLRREAELTI
jgi:hypothetical protein